MSLIFGNLDVAGLEHLASDPVTFLFKGRIYYNTTSNVVKYYNGTSWLQVADSGSSTSLSVKDTLFTIQDDGDATKLAAFQCSGISTGTTRTFTLPNANTTLLGNDNSAIVSNKSIDNTCSVVALDTQFVVQDQGDNTKQLAFQCSGITSGQTRTLTIPDLSLTIAGTASQQVMTNKDYDGGTASNTSRITLPKNTTTNLDGLSRKQGTLVYDTDTGEVKFDNGSSLAALASAATATSASLGIVSSYFPVIASSVKTFTNAGYTILDNDGYETFLGTMSGTDGTLTLPTLADNQGRILEIVKVDGLDTDGTGVLTIDGEGAETIGGDANVKLFSAGDRLRIVGTATTWTILSMLQVEYLYNTSSATAAGDTTSFGYGESGALIRNITAALTRRVRALAASKNGDTHEFQVSENQIGWFGLPWTSSTGITIDVFQTQNTTTYGAGTLNFVNTTDTDTSFGTYDYPTGATFASAGEAWAAGASGSKYWRIKKTRRV